MARLNSTGVTLGFTYNTHICSHLKFRTSCNYAFITNRVRGLITLKLLEHFSTTILYENSCSNIANYQISRYLILPIYLRTSEVPLRYRCILSSFSSNVLGTIGDVKPGLIIISILKKHFIF